MAETLLQIYEKEFKTEIQAETIELEDFYKVGVKRETLALESYLNKIYGDDVFNGITKDSVDEKAKTIKKLTESEFNRNRELKDILLELENSTFDDGVNKIFMIIRERE